MAYEAGVRTFAPLYASPEPDRRCDEWVGRFCLIYDAGNEKLPAQSPRLRAARDSAIAALRRAFRLAPGRTSFARALVRDLVRAGQTTAGVGIARAHARARPNDGSASMLLGYALHYDRQTPAALEAFASWLRSLSPERRAHVARGDWLLDPGARKQMALLSPTDRSRQDSILWRFADPLYLTPGNEVLADHLARNALAVMKLEGPRVWNAETWGNDVEQLLVRFGEPVITTREATRSAFGAPDGFSEHWDQAERTYFPPSLDRLQLKPRLDTIWPLDSLTARSGHAPPTLRIMKVLEHQSAAFGSSPMTYLVVGKANVDSAVHADGLVAALFLLDSSLTVIARTAATVSVANDVVLFKAEAPLPRDARFFSAEVYDTISRYAARARFSLTTPSQADGLTLSDLLLSSPDEPAVPLPAPLIVSGSRFGIYATLTGAGTVRLQLETRSLGEPGVPVRLARWLGRRLGLETGGSSPSLGWTVDVKPGVPSVVALAVDAGLLKPGKYVVRLTATPLVGGKTLVAEREFLVIAR